jgi:polar amino acid transport system substrate-binding protein
MVKGAWVALGLSFVVGGCGFPRDAEGTLERVRGGEMNVGVSENAPWVRFEGEEPRGIEPALIERWAEGLGAKIRWVRGTESDLVEALERREIDVLAAGLTDKTPWSKRMGVSGPYLTTRLSVGCPEGAPREWKGKPVVVAAEEPKLSALVRGKDGQPVPESERADGHCRAGHDFELKARGMEPTDPELATEKHVLAVAPGESAFLLDLDRFLRTTGEASIRTLAIDEVRR